jgi:hypothetical protein
VPSFHLTISDAPDFPGLYRWELRDGPFTEAGLAVTVSHALNAIARARQTFANTETAYQPSLPLSPPAEPSASFYPQPTRFG